MQIKKNRKTLPLPAAETKRSTEARFAWASGAEKIEEHDPLYHITESFQQSFDRIGQSHAAAAASGFHEEASKETSEDKHLPQTERDRQTERKERQDGKTPEKGRQRKTPGEDPTDKEPQDTSPLTRFSEIAFNRGAMSASVLNGTGKMMLVSCLKRTAYESGPQHLQQQRITDTGSSTWAIAGHAPDQMVFNRGFANSALGIVVDTLRDARRVVESMTAIARGAGDSSQPDRAALFKLYPFLDDSRDAALEAEYRKKLAECTDEREKPVLQNALTQAVSLRAKKAQMKNEFINKLRFVSDRATETLAELETPGAADEIAAAAFGEKENDLPENPDEGADGDAPNGKKNRAAETARTGAAAETAETGP